MIQINEVTSAALLVNLQITSTKRLFIFQNGNYRAVIGVRKVSAFSYPDAVHGAICCSYPVCLQFAPVYADEINTPVLFCVDKH